MATQQVTAIIPTFNRSEFLKRAIPSVLNQSHLNLELIVVDDGSTDDTKAVVESFKDSRIRYIKQKNQGQSAARNKGIQESKGEFIAFLDSDDEWLAKKIEKQIQFFKTHSDYLIVQTDEIWIRNGKRVNPMKKHYKSGGSIFEKCLPLSLVSPSCVMMRREFFDQVGFFDESLPACEDYDLWLRTAAKFPIGLLNKQFVIRYAGHPDQRSQEFPMMDQFRIASLVKLLNSGLLDSAQRSLAIGELRKKCRIVTEGSKKRGRFDQAKQYENLLVQYAHD